MIDFQRFWESQSFHSESKQDCDSEYRGGKRGGKTVEGGVISSNFLLNFAVAGPGAGVGVIRPDQLCIELLTQHQPR